MDEQEKRSWREHLELKKRSRGIKKHARKMEGATVRHARRFVVNRWDKVSEIRLHIIMWLGGVGLLIALVGVQMNWFQQSYVAQAAITGGTYAEAVKGRIDTLNPLYATTPAELSASHLLFSSLYKKDASGSSTGDLATRITNDGDKVFTVTMRHDARWHDGQPVTAADISFTVKLMKNPAVRSVMTSGWQGIETAILDNYTVKFTLASPDATFLQALTFSVLPEHLLKVIDPASLRESSFSTAPIGSGPFKLQLLQVVSQTAGRKIVHMDANADYYGGTPRLDRFQLHTYSDDDAIGQALRTGEVSGASGVASETAHMIDTKRYDTVIKPVNSGVYALFNLSQPNLKDLAVRQALLAGTDTTKLRKQIFGNPNALYLPFVNGQVAGTESIPAPQFNKQTAGKLLDGAGWVLKDGVRTKDNVQLQLKVVTRKNSDYEAVLESLVGQWRELGVKVDSQSLDPSTFTQDVLQSHTFDVLVDELVIGGDPDVFAYWHSLGRQNFSGYDNQLSDDALASARMRSDAALRAVKYTAFAKQWLADVPAIGLYQPNLVYVHTKNSQTIEPDEKVITTDDHYTNVRYWTAEKGSVYRTP